MRPLQFIWRKLGRRYPRLLLFAWFQVGLFAGLGGIGLLRLYQDMSVAEFWIIAGVTEALIAIEIALALRVVSRLLKPADPWLRHRRPEDALAAWQAMAALPLRAVTYRWVFALPINVIPIAVFIVAFLDLPWYTAPILVAGALIVLMYGIFLRFFGTEAVMRAPLEDAARNVPDGVQVEGAPSIPLKWRLLVALPAISIITGVVVSGLSTTGTTSVQDLGLDVLVAVVVAFTISLELSVMLTRSILGPLGDLRRATERVSAGDYATRVPVVTADETGRLSAAFNDMVSGLQERTALHKAFGSYVDPDLADRVLAEGAVLKGQEVEVTVMFLDIRGFTAYAERHTAREVVAQLNEFFEHVVPVLTAHGGHANKFVGDGLLGVFGAPDLRSDHANRAVDAALDIVDRVREVYGERLRIGVGVNSGAVLAGTVGGGGRLEFAVIGDPVNTAARVEQVTRRTDDDVLITGATRALLRDADRYRLTARGTVPLKGRVEPVALYAPLCGGRKVRSDGSSREPDRHENADVQLVGSAPSQPIPPPEPGFTAGDSPPAG